MKHTLGALLLLTLCSCKSSGIVEHRGGDLIELDSFALATRYGRHACQLSAPGQLPATELEQRCGRLPSHRADRPGSTRGRLRNVRRRHFGAKEA